MTTNTAIWERDEPQSPCVKICVMHPVEGLCVGCLRSLPEIATWGQMARAERQAILDDLPARAPRLSKRRGGRMARVKE
jgi:predicted Fe-S protein YdhL (DUF1289 family)